MYWIVVAPDFDKADTFATLGIAPKPDDVVQFIIVPHDPDDSRPLPRFVSDGGI